MTEDRSKTALEGLLGRVPNKKNVASGENSPKVEEEFVATKRNIEKLIKSQGSSIRKADSIRINPILSGALAYWISVIDRSKSKPDIVEEGLLKVIPEEYLIEGYKIAKRQNKI